MHNHPESDRSPDPSLDTAMHDRRYKIFVAVFATVILTFAAISITVVIVTS